MKKVISLNNVNKVYGSFHALKNVSFDVYEGEVFGFIGKNGAGKTTTINIMLSLLNYDSGSISFFEEDIDVSNVTYKKRIGYVPDVPVFPSFYTSLEYLKYVVEVFHIPKTIDDLIDILTFVGLDNSKKRIGQFSRGMKQRLAIGQALIHKPEILIMDEPTSALDPKGRKEVLDIINRLKGTTTVFYSTHILADAERVCDRIGLIDHGEIKFIKRMDEIVDSRLKTLFQIEFDQELDFESLTLPKGLSFVRKSDAHYVFDLQGMSKNDAIAYFIQEKLPLVSFTMIRPTLEDVFIEVTS